MHLLSSHNGKKLKKAKSQNSSRLYCNLSQHLFSIVSWKLKVFFWKNNFTLFLPLLCDLNKCADDTKFRGNVLSFFSLPFKAVEAFNKLPLMGTWLGFKISDMKSTWLSSKKAPHWDKLQSLGPSERELKTIHVLESFSIISQRAEITLQVQSSYIDKHHLIICPKLESFPRNAFIEIIKWNLFLLISFQSFELKCRMKPIIEQQF